MPELPLWCRELLAMIKKAEDELDEKNNN